jgi:hypothetical protein
MQKFHSFFQSLDFGAAPIIRSCALVLLSRRSFEPY